MESNKRSFVRLSRKFDVDIYKKDTYLGRGTTRDIHIDGAFISFFTELVEPNDILSLSFIIDPKERKHVNIRGLVIRASSAGAGILFSYKMVEYIPLLNAMYSHVNKKFIPNLMKVNSIIFK